MILITGGAGYIGSHTTLNFLENGYEVIIFDNLETGHIETIETLKTIGEVKFEKGDLRNIEDIEKVFKKYSIEAVIHFAAFALVEESVQNPAKYYRNNVVGTLNLLDTMIKYNVKKLVFSSTCATYGEPQYLPIDELHPQCPINPYGTSKLIVEKVMQDYDKAYDLKSIKLRYFNVAGCDKNCRIGECHEPETHLIPNILKSAVIRDKTFKIFGTDYDTPDGTCIRDYVNIHDLAEAHHLAYLYIMKENTSNTFNLGTEDGNSVKEVFEMCENILETKIFVKIHARRPGDPAQLFANSNKAKTILGWNPKHSIEDSIKTAYNWEKKN